MIATIVIAGIITLAVIAAAAKRVRDFRNHRYCAECSGCADRDNGSCEKKVNNCRSRW